MRVFRPAVCLLLAVLPAVASTNRGEGADLEFGGSGDGHGKLSGVADLTFGGDGRLYVLDSGWAERGRAPGNALVQVFDGAGHFVRQFSVADDTLGANFHPMRLAVDGRGQVWVSQPRAGVVQRFGADGRALPSLAVPGAQALAVRGERLLVLPSVWRKTFDQVQVFDLDGQPQPPLRLGQPLGDAQDLAVDRAGNLFVIAATNQLYKFAPDGRLLTALGSGMTTRAQDGSELLHSVALDSAGNVYTYTWGNPGLLVKFDAELKTVTTREGQFKWADPWSTHSNYVPLAVDANDRLWLGVPGKIEDAHPRYHYKPCVLRVKPDFLDPTANGVVQVSTKLLGLKAELQTPLPYSVAYNLDPVPLSFVVAPARRRIDRLSVRWRAQDTYGRVVATGELETPLVDGQEARLPFTFAPPRLGWYTLSAELRHDGESLVTIGKHLGITREYPGLPTLAAGESPGGATDIPRSAWCGHRLVRVHTGFKLADLDNAVAQAEKYGCVLLVQFENKEQCAPEKVKAVVEHFKGRVKYWEVINEPNFGIKPEDYAKLALETSAAIKALDPAALVMGPTVCGLDLGWHERAFKAGVGQAFDIVSVHDYEGHESLDPNHWLWKYGQLRELLKRYGCGDKPVWQTERAICGVRGENFLPGAQAVRVTLHRDTLDRLGIPSEHNLHYYVNEHGYGPVPTYLWSNAGPHPAALALRVRAALLGDRRYAGTLDFGALGNKLVWGNRYDGPDGSTLVLRNLGTRDLAWPLRLPAEAQVCDAFGNAVAAGQDGRLVLGQLPTYVRLPRGSECRPSTLDPGPNLAPGATFAYTDQLKGAERLTNGLFETIHAGNPIGGTGNSPLCYGALPSLPQTLTMTLTEPRTVRTVVLYGLRADNAFCALLEFDLQAEVGGEWRTLESVKANFPATERVRTPGCVANTWLLDDNVWYLPVAPVVTQRLRVVVKQVSCGFVPDDNSRAWGNKIPRQLMLKEIEVY